MVCGDASSLSPFATATKSSAALIDTFIDLAPPSQTVNPISQFSFSSNIGAEASFECSLDGEVFNSCATTTEFNFTGLPLGQHELLVRAKNGNGEVDLTPAVHHWTIGPLPDTAIVSGPEEATEERDATFQFTSNIPGATFECALDEMAENLLFLPCNANHTFTGLAFGDHELLVRARDNAGNVDPEPAEYSWEIGGIPPLVMIESGPDIESESRNATFTFSADTTDRIFLCSLDGSEPSPCQSPHTYNGLPLGAHTFEVQVYVDEEFAVAEAPVTTYEWSVVAVVPPETNIVFGPPPVSGGMDPEGGEATFLFAFSSNKTQALFECAMDGEAWEQCESPAEYSNLSLGDHLFRVRAYDLSIPPNYDPTPATRAFRAVPSPETTIVSGPEGEINGPLATFQFSSTVAGSTFECALDLGPFVTCSNPYTLTGLPDGEHLLEVRAKTSDGVVDISPEEWQWAVDGQLPDTAILTGPPAQTVSTGAVFTFSSTEGMVEYECSLDGGLFEGCEAGEPPLPESSHIAIELTPGQHTLRVRAVDEGGFFDPTPATLVVDDHPAARHRDRERAGARHHRRERDLHVHREQRRLDLRVLAQQRPGVRDLRLGHHLPRPRAGPLRLPRPLRHERRHRRPEPGDPRLEGSRAGRDGGARHDLHGDASGIHDVHERDLPLHRQRARRQLRVRARRRRLERLQLRHRRQQPRRRRAHVQRARDRRIRQRRGRARDVQLARRDGRRHAADRAHHQRAGDQP